MTSFFKVDVSIFATACNAVQRPYEKQNTIILSYCGCAPDSFYSSTRVKFKFWMSSCSNNRIIKTFSGKGRTAFLVLIFWTF
jgi:hypothetical protein